MFRKILLSFLLMIMFSVFVVSSNAAGKSAIYNPNTYSTEQFLANVTRPEVRNETTYKKIYLVCGSSENKALMFEALVFDAAEGYFKPVSIVGGGHTWKLNDPGIFAEQLVLPKTGANQIRIVTYFDGEEVLVPGKNLQVSDYTITLMEKNDKNLFRNGFQRIANMLGQLFR
jgi:hypothetical protein